jgi:hypothetical protein
VLVLLLILCHCGISQLTFRINKAFLKLLKLVMQRFLLKYQFKKCFNPRFPKPRPIISRKRKTSWKEFQTHCFSVKTDIYVSFVYFHTVFERNRKFLTLIWYSGRTDRLQFPIRTAISLKWATKRKRQFHRICRLNRFKITAV